MIFVERCCTETADMIYIRFTPPSLFSNAVPSKLSQNLEENIPEILSDSVRI